MVLFPASEGTDPVEPVNCGVAFPKTAVYADSHAEAV